MFTSFRAFCSKDRTKIINSAQTHNSCFSDKADPIGKDMPFLHQNIQVQKRVVVPSQALGVRIGESKRKNFAHQVVTNTVITE
jgi:hypothetical protein